MFSKINNFIKDRRLEPHSTRLRSFRYLVYCRFRWLVDGWHTFKGRFIGYDITSLGQLPNKFILFPLQVTPESSINVLAPYYVDQLRAVDEIIFTMDSDTRLVVKEHPVMSGWREKSFYRHLEQRAGVLTASPDLPIERMIERAEEVVTITGTAALEARILGVKSRTLAPCFCSRRGLESFTGPFFMSDPNQEPSVSNEENVREFINALKIHLEREGIGK